MSRANDKLLLPKLTRFARSPCNVWSVVVVRGALCFAAWRRGLLRGQDRIRWLELGYGEGQGAVVDARSALQSLV